MVIVSTFLFRADTVAVEMSSTEGGVKTSPQARAWSGPVGLLPTPAIWPASFMAQITGSMKSAVGSANTAGSPGLQMTGTEAPSGDLYVVAILPALLYRTGASLAKRF